MNSPKLKRTSLLVLIALLAVVAVGCSTVSKLLDGVEVCSEVDGKPVCIKLDGETFYSEKAYGAPPAADKIGFQPQVR